MPHGPAAIDTAVMPAQRLREEIDEVLARSGIFRRVDAERAFRADRTASTR